MQAFLGGRIKVDGDITKMIALQTAGMSGGASPEALEMARRLQAITACTGEPAARHRARGRHRRPGRRETRLGSAPASDRHPSGAAARQRPLPRTRPPRP